MENLIIASIGSISAALLVRRFVRAFGIKPNPHRFILVLSAGSVVSTIVQSGTALAADTIEAFDIGASDFDLYLGYEGLGLGSSERSVGGEAMLGYGIVDNLSAFIGTTLSGTEQLKSDSTSIFFGLFGNVVDSDHFDFDLYADFSGKNAETSFLAVIPGLEINLDRYPDLRTWGFYLRTAFPIFGREVETTPEESAETEVAISIKSTIGAYLTVAEGHQVLLEYDMNILPDPVDVDRGLDIGCLALGYNVYLMDELELINQISLDVPQKGETASLGFTIGLIATLPETAPAATETEQALRDE
ncbi:MAG: hypothetical protein JXA30_12665 [Deltaproteobacteria bacterium]|nr:hypothetical protein [Deltaproteobacteria bacterium]